MSIARNLDGLITNGIRATIWLNDQPNIYAGYQVQESDSVADAVQASTRERLVEAARELFYAEGFAGASVAEILKKAEVNSGSLYYFFKTKEDLLLAVLDRYVELLHPLVIDPVFSRENDPINRVFALLDGYRQGLLLTGCRRGCPIGNLALEMSDKSDAVRERIAVNFENWRVTVRQTLIDAGSRLRQEVDREKLATFVLTVMEGGVMLSRAARSIEPFDASVAMLKDYFDRLTCNDGGSCGPGTAR